MQLKLLVLAMIVFLAGCRPIAAPTATPVPTPAFAQLLKQYEAWQTQALARIDAYDADPTIFADSTWRLQTAWRIPTRGRRRVRRPAMFSVLRRPATTSGSRSIWSSSPRGFCPGLGLPV